MKNINMDKATRESGHAYQITSTSTAVYITIAFIDSILEYKF